MRLIFRGGARYKNADCVSVLKDDWFVTGHEDGHLSLWMSDKEKAVATVEHAHA
jgi:ribosomal RNA-processing protein 9